MEGGVIPADLSMKMYYLLDNIVRKVVIYSRVYIL